MADDSKIVTNAAVFLWGELVGAVDWDEKSNLAAFRYDPQFIKKGLEISPIMMPLSNEIYNFPELVRQSQHGLPGLLADSLPDRFGHSVMDKWLEENGRLPGSLNPVEELCFVGSRGMGALEYRPSFNFGSNKSEPISVSKLAEIAEEILDKKKKLSANIIKDHDNILLSLIKVGTSAGGARAKAIIAYNKTTGEVRSGQTDVPEGFEHWLIKFDGASKITSGDPEGFGRVEEAYYLMTKKAGINMMECELLSDNGRAHFMTKRFDRLPGNEKVHVQSLCALQHFDHHAEERYSYEHVFSTILELRLDHVHTQEMYRRMVFNILARNQDDHTKNLAFIMDKAGNWKLSPAFDMVYQYDPTGKWSKVHQLSANGKRDNFTLSDLEEVAERFNVYKAKDIRNKVADAVALWPKLAQEVGVNEEFIRDIRKTHRLDIMNNLSVPVAEKGPKQELNDGVTIKPGQSDGLGESHDLMEYNKGPLMVGGKLNINEKELAYMVDQYSQRAAVGDGNDKSNREKREEFFQYLQNDLGKLGKIGDEDKFNCVMQKAMDAKDPMQGFYQTTLVKCGARMDKKGAIEISQAVKDNVLDLGRRSLRVKDMVLLDSPERQHELERMNLGNSRNLSR